MGFICLFLCLFLVSKLINTQGITYLEKAWNHRNTEPWSIENQSTFIEWARLEKNWKTFTKSEYKSILIHTTQQCAIIKKNKIYRKRIMLYWFSSWKFGRLEKNIHSIKFFLFKEKCAYIWVHWVYSYLKIISNLQLRFLEKNKGLSL